MGLSQKAEEALEAADYEGTSDDKAMVLACLGMGYAMLKVAEEIRRLADVQGLAHDIDLRVIDIRSEIDHHD